MALSREKGGYQPSGKNSGRKSPAKGRSPVSEKKKGIPAQDFREAFLDVQLKKILGQKLTKGEEWIYYYGAHAPKCHHPKH